MELGLPGQRCDLHRSGADRNAGPRAGQQLAASEYGGNHQWRRRDQNLQTHHDMPPARPSPEDTLGAYGWRSVNKTRYRRVDAPRDRLRVFRSGQAIWIRLRGNKASGFWSRIRIPAHWFKSGKFFTGWRP